MTTADRKRLAHILGMLGSNSAGERDNAALLAERLRRSLGQSWEHLLDGHIQVVDCWIPPEPNPRPTPQPTPPAPIIPRASLWEKLDLPIWWIAMVCFVIGFLAGHLH